MSAVSPVHIHRRMSNASANKQSKKSDESGLPSVFVPVNWTLQDIRQILPDHVFERDSTRSMLYVFRDAAMAALAWRLASQIDSTCVFIKGSTAIGHSYPWAIEALRYALWATYWVTQSLVFTGLWVLAHECGHRGFSGNDTLCDSVGFVLHSVLLTPYYSWKISHHRHHMSTSSMERDELWIPATKSDLKIPESHHGDHNVEEYLGDTPIFTLLTLIGQQLIGFPMYLIFNTSGQKDWPGWTSHFNPHCEIFKPTQRHSIIMSDIGVFATISVLRMVNAQVGFPNLLKLYIVPWFLLSHWLVLITYLQHTDQRIPHYRGKAWTFCRGAAATIDRDFLGWAGRFFLHDISHYHVVHHFFPKIPFYHCEEATKYLKPFMGEQYQYSDKPVFKALWESYNGCQFVDDTGSIVFYRDRKGQTVRRAESSESE